MDPKVRIALIRLEYAIEVVRQELEARKRGPLSVLVFHPYTSLQFLASHLRGIVSKRKDMVWKG